MTQELLGEQLEELKHSLRNGSLSIENCLRELERILRVMQESIKSFKEEEMTLRQKQSKFAKMVALLIQFAYEKGYELTFGDAWAHEGHIEGSFHYIRLAIDLNLFKNGKFLTKTEDHEPLGLFWESIGGTWGGRWKDGNHYSLGEGKK